MRLQDLAREHANAEVATSSATRFEHAEEERAAEEHGTTSGAAAVLVKRRRLLQGGRVVVSGVGAGRRLPGAVDVQPSDAERAATSGSACVRDVWRARALLTGVRREPQSL